MDLMIETTPAKTPQSGNPTKPQLEHTHRTFDPNSYSPRCLNDMTVLTPGNQNTKYSRPYSQDFELSGFAILKIRSKCQQSFAQSN